MGSARNYVNLREFTQICARLCESARVYANLRDFTRICASLRESARVYANLREFTRICARLRESARDHHEADALDVLDVLAKTPGLYLIPELRYPCHCCHPCCCRRRPCRYPPPHC